MVAERDGSVDLAGAGGPVVAQVASMATVRQVVEK